MRPTLHVKPGRAKPILRRHPWVFSGALVRGARPAPGTLVDVHDADGALLGSATMTGEGSLCARMWSFGASVTLDQALFEARLRTAHAARAALGLCAPDAGVRVCHGAADSLPGLIVDMYGTTAVVQLGSHALEQRRDAVMAAVKSALGCTAIVERSDSDGRAHAGLEPVTAVVHGVIPEDGHVPFSEDGTAFFADVLTGHKTGFYLDQRPARRFLAAHARGKRVLNICSYTGAFTAVALQNGARHVTAIDRTVDIHERAEANLVRAGLDPAQTTHIVGNAFDVLRGLADEGEQFDVILLDPPKFARTAKHVEKASRGYKELNRLAFGLLAPRGTLMTFSCSGAIDAGHFARIVQWAAQDAGVDAMVHARFAQGADHPVRLTFPESDYLKGLAVTAAPAHDA